MFEHANLDGSPGAGGDQRECCEMTRVSDKQILCRLPRVSCITQVSGFPCPQPGLVAANQTVSLNIRPTVKGFDGQTEAQNLDRFVQYEGVWELVDEDIYGGVYVPIKDRAPGEVHILNAANSVARQSCCPVCPLDIPDRANCRLTISQVQNGIYKVTVPEVLTPGSATRSGSCDPATNYVNTSLSMVIETSTDPSGFTPTRPLSITNCPAGTGGVVAVRLFSPPTPRTPRNPPT